MNKSPSPCPIIAARSLSEHAHEARQTMEVARLAADAALDVVPLYARLYEKYLLRTPSDKALHDPAMKRALDAVVRYCGENRLDLTLYLAAQLIGLAPVSRRRYKFAVRPNMLTGPSAVGRYNAFVRSTDRQFTRAREDVLRSGETAVRDAVYEGELAVGGYYCAAAVSGDPATWAASIVAAEPPTEWLAAQEGARKSDDVAVRVMRLTWDAGPLQRYLPDMLRYATATAAAAVADRYRFGLSDRLGLTSSFTWESLAKVLAGMFPPLPRRAATRVRGALGEGGAWGATDLTRSRQ